MDYNRFSQSLRDINSTVEASSSSPSSSDQAMSSIAQSAPRETPAASTSASLDIEMADSRTSSRAESSMNSDNNTEEVEMEFEDPPLPEIEELPAPRPNNRRARVDDDDDEERDRRHPSQRITNPSSRQPTRPTTPRPTASTSNPPPTSSSSTPLSSSSTASNPRSAPTSTPNTTNPPPRAPRTGHPHPLFGGIAISFDIDGNTFTPAGFGGAAAGHPAQAQGEGGDQPGAGIPGGEAFADMFSNPIFLNELFGIEPDVEDPERADKLLAGLEEVPIGLVQRLERVGGIGATGTDLSGGDSGCAICYENLLDSANVLDTDEDVAKSKQKAKDESEKPVQRKIVSLPCAHVFHAECLRPWFSRPKQTTCPTCRFNIDPENLTFVPYRLRHRAAQAQDPAAGTARGENAARSGSPGTATPPPPSGSGSSTTTSEAPRGREETTAHVPPRRAGSEPPLNRTPRPTTQPEPTPQPFTIPGLPGSHVFILSPPIALNAQGQPVPAARPTEGAARQPSPDNVNSSGEGTTPAAAPGTSPSPTPEARPVFGPPPPPSQAGARLGGLPPGLADAGIIAFDIAFPVPASFFTGAGASGAPGTGATSPPPAASSQPQSSQPQAPPAGSETSSGQAPPNRPRMRFPGLFAGLGFGRPGEQQVNATELLRSVFDSMPRNRQPSNNTQSTSQPAPSNPTNANSPPSAAATDGSNAGTPPPTTPGAAPGEGARPTTNNDAEFLRFLMSSLNNPATLLRLLLTAGLMGAAAPGGFPGRSASTQHHDGPKKEWTPPPAPGPTLRQRIEKREREAGLRCSDVSCGIGPSDEEPYISEADAAVKQLTIHEVGNRDSKVCDHAFHSSCLVSAERVALRGADASIVGNDVEVSCPVCRGSGSISKADWDEGVHVLQ